MSNFRHVGESKPEAFLEKSVGVALPGYEWVQALGLLMHCCQDEELIKDLFEDQDTYNEMVLVVKKIQKQVLGVQEKIQLEAEVGSTLQLEQSPTKKIILM
jgi:hypothetical protein